MGIRREDIEAVFRTFLNRGANAAVIEKHEGSSSLKEFVEHVALSDEFLDRLETRLNRRALTDLLPLNERKIVFLHVPKCGGTTLHNLLTHWYGAGRMHPERHNGLYFYTAASLGSKTVFSGHFDFYSNQLIPGKKALISFLRDPKDRLISLYNFHRAHTPEVVKRDRLKLARLAHIYTIDEYFAASEVRAHPAINNAITRVFSNVPRVAPPKESNKHRTTQSLDDLLAQSTANLHCFDFIGFLDRYDQSIARLAEYLGAEPPQKVRKHQVLEEVMESKPAMRKVAKQSPSPQTLERIEDLIGFDRKLYDTARALFGRSVSDIAGQVTP